MLKFLLFTIICYLCLALPLDKNDLNQCLESTCFSEKSFCQNDTNCNEFLECFDLCSLNDLECIHKCSIPMVNNTGFWSVNLCTMDCLKGIEKSHMLNVEMCLYEQCITEISACSHDKVCNDIIKGIKGCKRKDGKIDYICAGKFVTENIAHCSIMFSLIHCNISCIWRFVS